ncbi:SMC family ATPase [Streptomyces europaeiscabiei]|uniref:SMC family ATPase n=1 Tax=Streptomyces europaeiscabiei TaxID=146819 RepID=UPI002E11EC87|nr:SMC family ATPase [Streptomyces europaeiscabiei]WSG28415.1 SMC family ATPase [Streptomyces europaeiscabiei]
MRLHSLHLQAFGPFARRHTVDFDALSADGLFLLHGDTGAGKSTLFAAICFALYGLPPHERNMRLRSDHAPADLLTEVTLEVTLAGKRLQIRRIPAQKRPHLRNSAELVDQKAETYLHQWVLDEHGHGRWEGIIKSHKEAGEEIKSLLRLTRQQFCQVVLLPQNEFTKFLRADASERRVLLGTLFGTRRFGLIEEFLANRKTLTAKTRDEARADVLRLAERIQQAAGDDLEPAQNAPRADDPATLTAPARAWATALHRQALTRQDAADAATEPAEQQLTEARRAEQAVRDLYRLQQAHRTTAHDLGLLHEQTTHHDHLAERRDRAVKAQQLQSVLETAHTADREHTRALDDDSRARALLPPEHASLDTAGLTHAGQQLHAETGAVQALLPDEATLQRHTTDLAALDRERQQLTETLTDAQQWLNALPQRRADLATRLETARSAQETSRELTPTLNLAEKQLEAARRRDALDQQISAAHKVLSQAEKDSEQAAKTYVDIRRRRTDGIVAELAGRLVDGEDCPVCGSPTHPAPATAQPGQPTAADEQAAEAAHNHAQKTQNNAKEALAQLNEQAATARGEAGGNIPLTDLTAHRTDLEQHLADALSQAADAGPAGEQLTLLEKEQADTEHTRNTATARMGAADATYDSLHTQREELTHRLATALNGHATLADRITHLTQHAGRLEAAAACAATVTTTATDRHSATALAEQAAHAAGFTSPAEASAARLPDDELTAIDKEITHWREQRLVLTARLAEPELQAAITQPPADLEHAVTELNTATTTHTRTAALATQAADRTTTLATLTAQLDTQIQRLEPLEDAYRTVDHLHGLISGGSPSNQLRMQLESYVLAARLEDVVDAANTRLSRMSHHRFTLVHSDDRAARGAKSGLDLKVLDAWSGHKRHTDTLSGGESFYVSLALALGLADIVTAEAGGQALDTLFIDEGFGTLDEDTLHQVLDVLDSLRAHDRTVGLISHVPELRRRITQRLHIAKHIDGSTLTHLTEAAE